jgi:hypothetical protein
MAEICCVVHKCKSGLVTVLPVSTDFSTDTTDDQSCAGVLNSLSYPLRNL